MGREGKVSKGREEWKGNECKRKGKKRSEESKGRTRIVYYKMKGRRSKVKKEIKGKEAMEKEGKGGEYTKWRGKKKKGNQTAKQILIN